MSCANLECDQDPAHRLRYQAPEGDHVYNLCDYHLDRAHHWLATRPRLAVTAISERIHTPVDQPALF